MLNRNLILSVFLVLSGLFSSKLAASEPVEHAVEDTLSHVAATHGKEHGSEEVDITKVAFEHILDSHSWHFWGEGHDAVAMPAELM